MASICWPTVSVKLTDVVVTTQRRRRQNQKTCLTRTHAVNAVGDATGAGRARARPPRTGALRRACHPWPAQSTCPAPSAQRPLPQRIPRDHAPVRVSGRSCRPDLLHQAAYRHGRPRPALPSSARPAGGAGRRRPGAGPTGVPFRPGRPRRAAPGARATTRSAVGRANGQRVRRTQTALRQAGHATGPSTPRACSVFRTEVTAPW